MTTCLGIAEPPDDLSTLGAAIVTSGYASGSRRRTDACPWAGLQSRAELKVGPRDCDRQQRWARATMNRELRLRAREAREHVLDLLLRCRFGHDRGLVADEGPVRHRDERAGLG